MKLTKKDKEILRKPDFHLGNSIAEMKVRQKSHIRL